jgi:hypothetical protein
VQHFVRNPEQHERQQTTPTSPQVQANHWRGRFSVEHGGV